MQFQKGQSGNPAGRLWGSFSPTAMLAEQMLSSDAEGIIRKTIDKRTVEATAVDARLTKLEQVHDRDGHNQCA